MRAILSKRVEKLENAIQVESSKYHFVICRSQDEIDELDITKNHIILRMFKSDDE